LRFLTDRRQRFMVQQGQSPAYVIGAVEQINSDLVEKLKLLNLE
jgi:hypothetical protein